MSSSIVGIKIFNFLYSKSKYSKKYILIGILTGLMVIAFILTLVIGIIDIVDVVVG